MNKCCHKWLIDERISSGTEMIWTSVGVGVWKKDIKFCPECREKLEGENRGNN